MLRVIGTVDGFLLRLRMKLNTEFWSTEEGDSDSLGDLMKGEFISFLRIFESDRAKGFKRGGVCNFLQACIYFLVCRVKEQRSCLNKD